MSKISYNYDYDINSSKGEKNMGKVQNGFGNGAPELFPGPLTTLLFRSKTPPAAILPSAPRSS